MDNISKHDVATASQILQIQGIGILNYVAKKLEQIKLGEFDDKTIDKFKKLFDIINDKNLK